MDKEKIKDLGRKIIGQGPEVEFKNAVLEHERKHKMSHEAAEKDIFSESLDEVIDEINSEGMIDFKSKAWRRFEGGRREIFSTDQAREFIKDADDPKLYSPPTMGPVKPIERKRVGDYYKGKYGSQPENVVLDESAIFIKEIKGLAKRFNNSHAIFSTPESLKDYVTSHQRLGADIGKMTILKRELERHENFYNADLKFQKDFDNYKKESPKLFKKMFADEPANFIKAVMGNWHNPYNMIGPTWRFVSQETGSLIKYIYLSVKAVKNDLAKEAYKK